MVVYHGPRKGGNSMPQNLVKYKERYTAVEVGCKLWDNCFSCPLPAEICGRDVNMRMERYKTVAILLHNRGYSIAEIAGRLGKSEKQIERYLKEVERSTERHNFLD